ncbi:MAG TPA: hypothetical protein ENK91_08135 [Bacteroidetes bacterium]|nr:hypothetical protein [Bacteroidota bacterium]
MATKNKIPGLNIAFTVIIITEIMFFAGLISAYIIASSKAMDWPPIDQPRLPQYLSISNVIVLLLSGFFMFQFVNKAKEGVKRINYLILAIVFGIVFLVIQGSEWIKLVNFGIQTSDGLYASYFYSIIAIHGFHVLIGLILIIMLYLKLSKINDDIKTKLPLITSFGMFWYFVCLLWPLLYFLLYIY